MPAAAVIPAPIAYIKVVAVKTLVVELGARRLWSASRRVLRVSGSVGCTFGWGVARQSALGWPRFTLRKLECSKQALVPE